MSLVEIAYHNENVKMILYKKPPPRPKSPMPYSKREILLKRLAYCTPQKHQTMGEPEVTLRPPCRYLKKGDGEKKTITNKERVCRTVKKAYNDIGKAPDIEKSTKKKEKSNKVKYKKDTRQMMIDDERGHRSRVIKNEHIYNKDYGVTPKFITDSINEKKRLEDEYRTELENREPMCKAISPEERLEVLNGLMHNRDQLQKEFLTLPMVIDTIPKINRKIRLEKELLHIEKIVDIMERNPYIYIYD